MITTITNSVEGYQIAEYKGIVEGEAILGANVFQDVFAGINVIIGGCFSVPDLNWPQSRLPAAVPAQAVTL